MSDKPLSDAQRELVRHHLYDTDRDPMDLRDVVTCLALIPMLGGLVMMIGVLIALCVSMAGGPDLFMSSMVIGALLGIIYPIVTLGMGTRDAINYCFPRLSSVKDPELAQIISTALPELPAGFQWSFDVHSNTLGITPDGYSGPIVKVHLNRHPEQNAVYVTDADNKEINVRSDQGFTGSLAYATSALYDFFIATKHLSKDPIRIDDVDSDVLRITRDTVSNQDRNIITGYMRCTKYPDRVHALAATVVMKHRRTYDLPMRLIAATLPAWLQFHHEITQTRTTREQRKSAAANQFLLDSALNDISRAPQPTDDELLNEL